jgi:DNA-binding response OmpR family regulator
MSSRRFVGVVGPTQERDREGGSVQLLRQLGAHVRSIDLWDDASQLFESDDDIARAVVVEAGARPDLGALVLRNLRKEPRLEGVGTILAIDHQQVARFDPSSGFDDFVLTPLVPAELYARIRSVEWRKSEFTNEEILKLGAIVVDRAAREVRRDGVPIVLTAREFELLVYLADSRGRVVSRSELLERVWGTGYDGGARTIDIHVTRLRSKLGSALDLTTFRGAGYRLGAPAGARK